MVILRDAYCHGRIPPWAVVQGLEKCRFSLDQLSTAEYIELNTLQDETLIRPEISLKDFDNWIAANKTIPAPSTTTMKPNRKQSLQGQGKIKKKPIPTKMTTPFSDTPSTTTTTTSTSIESSNTPSGQRVDVIMSVSVGPGSITSSTTVQAGKAEFGDTTATGTFLYSVPLKIEFFISYLLVKTCFTSKYIRPIVLISWLK